MIQTVFDPPSGWKYGFPKVKPDDDVPVGEWLLAEGYPADMIPLALKYTRQWEEEFPEEDV